VRDGQKVRDEQKKNCKSRQRRRHLPITDQRSISENQRQKGFALLCALCVLCGKQVFWAQRKSNCHIPITNQRSISENQRQKGFALLCALCVLCGE
jgi:hypothetical protein